MSIEKNEIFHKYDFSTVLNRIETKTGKLNQAKLAEIVGVSQSAIAKRKKDKTFPEEWAFRIGQKYNLLTEWILKGEGPQNLGQLHKSEPVLINQTLSDINDWFQDDPKRELWFEVAFEDRFPEFIKWKERKERENNISLDKKIA